VAHRSQVYSKYTTTFCQKDYTVNTAPEPKIVAEEPQERPFLPLTKMIQIFPAGTSFGGWGPSVGTSLPKNWN
jgi:hypothetical protein